MSHYLTITPRDPLIARDSRPFGVGQAIRMRSLSWPYPSVLAGSLRTLLGKQAGGDFPRGVVENLKGLSVAGPLPMAERRLYFPVPADLVVREEDRHCFAARPVELSEDEGCDLPEGVRRPVLLPLADSDEDFKPARIPDFLSRDRMTEWLCAPCGTQFPIPIAGRDETKGVSPEGFLTGPEKDERVHVHIDRATGAAKESELFMTVGLDCHLPGSGNDGPDGGANRIPGSVMQLAARVDDPSSFAVPLDRLDSLHPMGGERRLVRWQRDDERGSLWKCPDEIRDTLHAATKVRMVLATPAIFSAGWRPGWLKQTDSGLIGTAPNTGVSLRLTGVSLQRWQPVSGWSLEKGRLGPKPIWRTVPAGGVYFFDVMKGSDPGKLAGQWLQPVCDVEQHNRDGFGLALWGIWESHQPNGHRGT